MMTDEDVTLGLADYLGIEYVRFDDVTKINMNVARTIPESISKRFCLVGFGELDDKIVVVMADPLDVIAIDTVTLKINRQIKVVISSQQEIRRAIEIVYHGSDVEEQRLRDLVKTEVGDEEKSVGSSLAGCGGRASDGSGLGAMPGGPQR